MAQMKSRHLRWRAGCFVNSSINSSISQGWSVVVSHSLSVIASLLPQEKVHTPASSDVDTGLTAVVQDVLVDAAGFFERISENRKVVERSLGVDGLGQLLDGRCEPSRVEGKGIEGIAEDVTEVKNFFSCWTATRYLRGVSRDSSLQTTRNVKGIAATVARSATTSSACETWPSAYRSATSTAPTVSGSRFSHVPRQQATTNSLDFLPLAFPRETPASHEDQCRPAILARS